MKALFVGSFDPFHEGHEYIVEEALKSFKFLYIVISWNEEKKRKYSFSETKKVLEEKYKKNKNIKIIINENKQTSEIAYSLNCFNIVRGFRNEKDLDYENKIKEIYQNQNKKIKLFYYHNPKLINISSSKIKKSI